jgi:hypothetical protein
MARSSYIFVFLFYILTICCSRSVDYPPILVLADDSGFGSYTGEILKAEGFNEFRLDSLEGNKLTSNGLNKFDIVILAKFPVDLHLKNKLKKFVREGGNLIAIKPDTSLQDLFGMSAETGTFSNGFVVIDTMTVPGHGLTGRPIQFHGTAKNYSLKGGRAIASFSAGKGKDESTPAVVEYNYGKGHTMAFVYNLPENIVLTRQGNPAFSGVEKDGIPGIRAMDMFTDGWVESSGNVVNQADEQMQLLSHCIESMCKRPLPRLWYFPDNLNCFITITNDGEYRNENDFEPQFRDLDSLEAKMSLYILETDKVSPRWVKKWTEKGFEISGHPDDIKNANDPHWEDMNQALSIRKKEIADMYGLNMRTVANHWFVWCGKDYEGSPEFAAQAGIEANKGILMDVNYAHYDNNSNQGHFLGPLGELQGNFTGSGLPMKFADSKGKVLNIYQHLNNVYDQQYNENKDASAFFDCFKGLLDRSLDNETYSFISIKVHNDEYYFSKEPLIKMLDYAKSHHVPAATAVDLLDFLKTKEEAFFTDIKMTHNHTTFKINSSINNNYDLTILLPAEFKGKNLNNVTISEKPVHFTKRSIKGYEYILFTIDPGKNYEITASYANN